MAAPLDADFSVTKAVVLGTALSVRLLHQQRLISAPFAARLAATAPTILRAPLQRTVPAAAWRRSARSRAKP